MVHRPASVLVLAVLLAGCGGGSDDEAAAEATTSSTVATTASTTTTTTEPTTELPDNADSGRSELEDGTHFGFWDSFEIGDTVAFGEFDLAYFLTGADAATAAAEHGDVVENDYYIVNDNPRLRTIIAHGDTEVLVLADDGGSPDHEATNVADYAVDRRPDTGVWVTIENGVATRIEEQFVP
jgi:hypothetical protein